MPSWVWIQNVVLPILGMGLGGLFMFGVYRTVNRWIDRRHEREMAARGQFPTPALERLQERVEALEDVAYRVQELEERVDFAERVLARGRGAERLERPPS